MSQVETILLVEDDSEIQLDVRIIGATHRNLTEAVADGSFREDLFYRLETFALQVPPLRARRRYPATHRVLFNAL